MKIRKDEGLAFDDVLLVPRRSSIKSRFNDEINLHMQLTPNIKLTFPIITAAMDRICESRMANAVNEFGGLGIIHRFMDEERYDEEFRDLAINFPRVLGIGLGESGLRRLSRWYCSSLFPPAVHVDVAYANTPFMFEFIQKIKREFPEIDIIVGSVATYDGAELLCRAGADAIRSGVGSGSSCLTSITTGNGIPQLTAIIETKRAVDDYFNETRRKVSIICDGGVNSGGDVMKALAAGADAVMTGNLLAGTEETPGEVLDIDGKLFKTYRGMSSTAAQTEWKGKYTSIEGGDALVQYRGPVKNVLQDLWANMMSSMSYQGARNLKQLRENAEFIKITPAGMKEKQIHIKRD